LRGFTPFAVDMHTFAGGLGLPPGWFNLSLNLVLE